VIAEGVETQAEMDFLQVHRCDEAQGYYFAKPMPAGQFASLLRRRIPKPQIVISSPLPVPIRRGVL